MCNELQTPPWQPPAWRGRQVFEENRAKNLELLRQYEGKHVAWFCDGSGIRDADVNIRELWLRIWESGENPCRYYYEYRESEGARDGPPWWSSDPWLCMHQWMANRNHNCEMLLGYEGKLVAWYPDGSGIRDADEDQDTLSERIRASGDDPEWYRYEYVSTMASV